MSTHDEDMRKLKQALEIPSGKEWESTIRLLLRLMGEDPDRAGLRRTPLRVKQATKFLTSGYKQDPAALFGRVLKNVKSDEMILVRDIDFFSLCEHHMLPFFGRCHIAYIPDKKVIGLSKIPRLVDLYARRLQVQERLTGQIAQSIMEHLQPRGVACVMEAEHLCLTMRGVQKQNARAITSAMLGAFRTSDKTRAEFLNLISSRRT